MRSSTTLTNTEKTTPNTADETTQNATPYHTTHKITHHIQSDHVSTCTFLPAPFLSISPSLLTINLHICHVFLALTASAANAATRSLYTLDALQTERQKEEQEKMKQITCAEIKTRQKLSMGFWCVMSLCCCARLFCTCRIQSLFQYIHFLDLRRLFLVLQ